LCLYPLQVVQSLFLLSTEIDGEAARTLADYQELALGLLDSLSM